MCACSRSIVAWHTLVLSLLLSISYLLTVPEGFMPESSNIACVVQSYVGDFAATGASMLAFFSALVLWWMTHPRTRLLGTDRARRRSSARLVTIILVVCYSTPALLQVASVFQDRYPLGGMCTPGTLMWETVSRSTLVRLLFAVPSLVLLGMASRNSCVRQRSMLQPMATAALAGPSAGQLGDQGSRTAGSPGNRKLAQPSQAGSKPPAILLAPATPSKPGTSSMASGKLKTASSSLHSASASMPAAGKLATTLPPALLSRSRSPGALKGAPPSSSASPSTQTVADHIYIRPRPASAKSKARELGVEDDFPWHPSLPVRPRPAGSHSGALGTPVAELQVSGRRRRPRSSSRTGSDAKSLTTAGTPPGSSGPSLPRTAALRGDLPATAADPSPGQHSNRSVGNRLRSGRSGGDVRAGLGSSAHRGSRSPSTPHSDGHRASGGEHRSGGSEHSGSRLAVGSTGRRSDGTPSGGAATPGRASHANSSGSARSGRRGRTPSPSRPSPDADAFSAATQDDAEDGDVAGMLVASSGRRGRSRGHTASVPSGLEPDSAAARPGRVRGNAQADAVAADATVGEPVLLSTASPWRRRESHDSAIPAAAPRAGAVVGQAAAAAAGGEAAGLPARAAAEAGQAAAAGAIDSSPGAPAGKIAQPPADGLVPVTSVRRGRGLPDGVGPRPAAGGAPLAPAAARRSSSSCAALSLGGSSSQDGTEGLDSLGGGGGRHGRLRRAEANLTPGELRAAAQRQLADERAAQVASGALSKRHGATSSLSNTTPTNQEPRVPTFSSSGANFARHGLAVSTGSSAVGIATTGLPTSAGRLCEELAVSERSLVARGGSPRASSRGGTTASSGRFPFRNTESGRALAVAAASIDRPSGGATYVPPSASQALRDALSNARFPNPPTGVLRAWATDAVAEPDEPTKLEALARLRTAERAREALAVTDDDLAVANALKTIQGTATASPMAGASDDGHEHDATAVPGSPSHPGALLSAAAGELSDGGPSSAAVHEAVVRRLVLAGGMGQRGRDLTTRRNKTKPYGSSAMSEGATSAGTSVLSPSARDDNSDSGRARADDGDDGDDDRSGRVRSGMTAASGFDSSNSVWETPDNEQQRRRLLRMGLFSVESEEGDGASGERGRGGASDSAGLPMPLVPSGASASSHQLASLATARVAGATGVVVGVSSMSRNGVGSEAAVASLVRRSRGSASGTVGGRGSMASSAGLRGPLSQASAGAARPIKATPPGVWAVEGAMADASSAPAAAHCSPSSLPATGATESTAAGASSTKQAGVLDAGALPDFGSVDVTSPEAGAPDRSGQAAKAGRQGPSPEGAASTRGAGVVAALMAADSEFDIPYDGPLQTFGGVLGSAEVTAGGGSARNLGSRAGTQAADHDCTTYASASAAAAAGPAPRKAREAPAGRGSAVTEPRAEAAAGAAHGAGERGAHPSSPPRQSAARPAAAGVVGSPSGLSPGSTTRMLARSVTAPRASPPPSRSRLVERRPDGPTRGDTGGIPLSVGERPARGVSASRAGPLRLGVSGSPSHRLSVKTGSVRRSALHQQVQRRQMHQKQASSMSDGPWWAEMLEGDGVTVGGTSNPSLHGHSQQGSTGSGSVVAVRAGGGAGSGLASGRAAAGGRARHGGPAGSSDSEAAGPRAQRTAPAMAGVARGGSYPTLMTSPNRFAASSRRRRRAKHAGCWAALVASTCCCFYDPAPATRVRRSRGKRRNRSGKASTKRDPRCCAPASCCARFVAWLCCGETPRCLPSARRARSRGRAVAPSGPGIAGSRPASPRNHRAVSGSSAGAGGGRGASSATESTLFFDSSVPVAKGGTPVRPKRRNRDCKRAARCVCQSTRWLGQGFVTLSTCGCCGCEEEFRSSAVVASTLFTSVLPVLGLLSAENSFAAQNPTATLLDFPRYEYQDMVALPPEMRTISRAFVARMIVRVALQMWLGLLLTAEHATSKLVFSVILDLLGCRFGRACCPVVARCASCSRDAGLVLAPAANTRCGRWQRDCSRAQRACSSRLAACCESTCGLDCCSFHDGDGDTVASDSEGPPSGRRRGSGRQSHLARGSFRQTSALPGASDDSTLARTLANRSGSSPSGPTVVPSGILGGSLNRFGLEPVSSAGSWPTAASDSMSDSSSRKLPRARHSEGSAGVVYGPDGAIIERLEPWVAGGLAFSVARTVPDVPVSACGGGVGSGQRSAVLSRAASHRKSKRQLLHPDDGSGKKVSAAAGRDVTQAQTLPSAVSRRMAAAHSPDSGHNAGPSQAWYRALLHRERPGEAHAPWSGKGPP